MKHYKYIHLFFKNDIKFNESICAMIQNPDYKFNMEEHAFVVMFQEVYDVLGKYDNVIFDDGKNNPFNKYGKYCDWMIAHSVHSIFQLMSINKKYLNKVIYRYWGYSLAGFNYHEGKKFTNIIKRCLNIYYYKKLHKFAAVGIANIVDIIDIRKQFKNIPLYQLPYMPDINSDEVLERCKSSNYTKSDVINVVIGHRSGAEGNHYNIIKWLMKYPENRLKIYIPLSYGDEKYAKELTQFIEKLQKSNIEIISNFMNYEEYLSFVNKMDIGIFDGEMSYALGNISIFLTFNKTVFLNRKGLIKEAFDMESIPCRCVDEIPGMDIDEFCRLFNQYDSKSMGILPKDEYLNMWYKFLDTYN